MVKRTRLSDSLEKTLIFEVFLFLGLNLKTNKMHLLKELGWEERWLM